MTEKQIHMFSNYSFIIKRIIEILFFSLIGILFIIKPSWAQVVCSPYAETNTRPEISGGPVTLTTSSPPQASPSRAVIARGTALGKAEVIGRLWSNAVNPDTTCRFWKYELQIDARIQQAGFTNNGRTVYETGTSGIGFTLRVANLLSDDSTPVWVNLSPSGRYPIYTDPAGSGNGSLYLPRFKIEVDFVATGQPIPPGTNSLLFSAAAISATDNNNERKASTTVAPRVTFIVPELTCLIQGSTLNLSLPPVNVIDVRGWPIGTQQTTPQSNVGEVNLSCPQGVELHATYVDANNRANRSNVLSVGAGNANAQGVGLVLSHQVNTTSSNGWNRVSYGAESREVNNPGQFRVATRTQTANQIIRINTMAQYIRTGNTVTTGNVDGKALLIFSYQ